MRYLLLLTTDSAPPSAALQRFTVELIQAGVLLAGELLAVDGLLVELGADGSCRVAVGVVDRAGLRPGGGCRMGEAAAGGSWQSRGAPHRQRRRRRGVNVAARREVHGWRKRRT